MTQCCRLGGADQPDCLRQYSRCPRLATVLAYFWRHAGIRLRPNLLLHEMLTQTVSLGAEHGIRVLDIVDAFVYAHNHHFSNRHDLEHFEDCLQGRIRTMIGFAPACAHALQLVCLGRSAGDVLVRTFRLFASEASCYFYPMFAQQHVGR